MFLYPLEEYAWLEHTTTIIIQIWKLKETCTWPHIINKILQNHRAADELRKRERGFNPIDRFPLYSDRMSSSSYLTSVMLIGFMLLYFIDIEMHVRGGSEILRSWVLS